MKLNRWTILGAILLVSTVIGLVYLPFMPNVGFKLTPLFYTALGLTSLQAAVVIAAPIAAIIFAIFRLVRTERRADVPLSHTEAKEDTSTVSVLAGYLAVKVLWWTYFTHLALGLILETITIIVLTVYESDWIFPPAYGLIVFLPLYAAFAVVLYMVHRCTYSGAYRKSVENSAEDRSAPLAMPRKAYIGAFAIGWLIVPIVAAFYWTLTVDLWRV